MKTARTGTFLGALIAGLLCGHAQLRAQPASDPGPLADDPARTGGDRIPADDAAIEIDDPNKPWSQGVSMENRSAARAIFLEGNRLFWVPLFARAAERYTAALALWKHPAFYFNLALAQLNLGQEVEARESLERALAHGEEPLGEKLYQEGQKRLDEVKRQLGRIRVICRTPGAEVTLDGVTLFVGPGSYEGWAKAEPHDLTAKKVGYQSEARRVPVSAGALLDVDLSLLTLTQAADTSRRWAVWKPWAVIGTGAAVAAAGGVLHTLAARNFDAHDEDFSRLRCAQFRGCEKAEVEPRLDAQLARARNQQATAVGGYVAGGALIATGAVLLYLNRTRVPEGAVSSPIASMAVVPTVSEHVLGVLISVSR